MQDSRHQLDKNNALLYILLTSPLVLWALCVLHPTFDDWSYVTSPYQGEVFVPERMFIFFHKWRPIDALYGSFLGLYPKMFPWLNHFLVLAAHIVNTILIWKLAVRLSFSKTAINMALIFFYISPAVIGTLYGIDSMNQAFSQLWGLLGLWIYINNNGAKKYILWLITLVLATLTKENGIMWAVITPVFCYGLQRSEKQELRKSMLLGMMFIVLYLAVRLCIPTAIADADSDYFSLDILKRIKYFAAFLCYPWLAIDYVSVLYAPERNLLLIGITALLSLPLLWQLFVVKYQLIKERRYITIVICALLAALPHLLTAFSVMHTYAAHPFWALLVALIISSFDNKKPVIIAFMCYCIAAVIVDYHHWTMSYQSGMLGKQLTLQAIEKTQKGAKKVFLIEINRHQPKYSSFCVTSIDAFAWGFPVKYYTDYQWPEVIEDKELDMEETNRTEALADSAIHAGYEVVWLLDFDHIDIIRDNR